MSAPHHVQARIHSEYSEKERILYEKSSSEKK
jgi:hypothetical protein